MSLKQRTYNFFGIPLLKLEEKYQDPKVEKSAKSQSDDNTLRLAFYNGGGLGDSIIDVAFIQNLRKILPPSRIVDYYAKAGKTFEKCPFLNNIYTDYKKLDRTKYDVILGNHRFWIVNQIKEDKVKRLAPKLYEFCMNQLDLRNNILRNTNDNNNLYGQYALLFGKNRWEQLDLKEITGFNRHSPFYMPLSPEYFSILKRYNLEPKQYVTINRGVDSCFDENCPKLWPLDHYKKFVRLLKEKYPHLTIVQIGANTKFGKIDADINLLGKTDIEETKILLKYALIHIDVEGGLVQLNHILHGKSCVIFGPTEKYDFAYEENINIKSNGCPHSCHWITPDWQKKCLRGFSPAPCMSETTPEIVLSAVSDYIDKPRGSFRVETIGKYTPKADRIYCMGEKENKLVKCLTSDKIVVFWQENPDSKKYDFLTDAKIEYGYGNLYNMPSNDGAFSEIIWVPETGNFHHMMTFWEMLRILKSGGRIIFESTNLNEDVRNFLNIKKSKSNQLITIIKE